MVFARGVYGQNQVRTSRPNPETEINLDLPRFDLDFRGGNPEKLIDLINEKLPDAPLNVIIPTEYSQVEIPPMKLKHVTAQQVFEALMMASQKQVSGTGFAGFGQPGAFGPGQFASTTYYSFQAKPPIQTNSVWYFVYQKPPQPEDQRICRFYQLSLYLSQGLKIDDITTAIQAGYKMLNEPAPDLNFHKETQLLIACGASSKMKMIDEVLMALPKAKEPANAGPSLVLPRPGAATP
jgi:hypothetical protein